MGEVRAADFRPAWWLRGAHMQTLWPSLLRRRELPELAWRRLELDDGDFLDLALGNVPGPTVVVIHGLEGDLRSHYSAGIVSALATAGFRPVFMHLRGRSGEPNRLPRSYHSGATEDLVAVLDYLTGEVGEPPLAAVGFSLGGNLLLKHLGENAQPRIRTAVAVSVPFLLRDAMLRLSLGKSRLYQRHLLGRLKASYRVKLARGDAAPVVDLGAIHDLFDFDDRITAPLNGFADAEDYYARCSCRPFLKHIRTPTLIIHSVDDPFMFPHTMPQQTELGPGVTLELTEHGGHVGFVAGTRPWRPRYWLEDHIVDYLRGLSDTPVSRSA